MQRRQQGKEIADLKQKQKEMEIKEIAEERRKAKQADKEALRKIREQIEADRYMRSSLISINYVWFSFQFIVFSRDKAVKYDQKKSAEEAKHLEDEARAKEEKATKEAAELAAKRFF